MTKKKEEVTVSICMITYNHEKYIAEAIRGVLMQKTNFQIKLIIGEDCSLDNTRAICEQYAKDFPEVIELLPKPETNLGMSKNFIRTLKQCKGSFIAFCEGDDYWTTKDKLEKQVNFLVSNPEYSLCSHLYTRYNFQKEKIEVDRYSNVVKDNIDGLTFDKKLFLKNWLAKTLTIMIRNDCNYSTILEKYSYSRDLHLIYHVLNNGKGYCLNYTSGYYRKHSGGIHSTLDNFSNSYIKYAIFKELRNYNPNDKDIKKKYNEAIKNFINNILYSSINKTSTIKLNQIKSKEKIKILLLKNASYTMIMYSKILIHKIWNS